MKNVLLDKGIILPSGEISKDKVNLVTGAITQPFAEMVWVFPGVSAGIAGLLQMGKSDATRPRGSWDANRFAASPQVALASPSGGWSFY